MCYASKLRKATLSSDLFKSQEDERVFAVRKGKFVLTMDGSKHHVRSPKRKLISQSGSWQFTEIKDRICSFLLFLDDST